MSYKILDTDTVLKTWGALAAERGQTSCSEVAYVLNGLGYYTKRGKPLTRQAIAYQMNKTPAGQKLLGRGRQHGDAGPRCSECGRFLGEKKHRCVGAKK